MGYTTDFEGTFTLDRPLSTAQSVYLMKFAETRRMERKASLTETRPDPIRKSVGLPVGDDGGYFVGAEGQFGQEKSEDVLNYNSPPAGQPGLWCQWIPTLDMQGIQWDGNEKFYNYVEWLEYIIENFLKPWGFTLNGEVEYQGEDPGDTGFITVKDNEVSA